MTHSQNKKSIRIRKLWKTILERWIIIENLKFIWFLKNEVGGKMGTKTVNAQNELHDNQPIEISFRFRFKFRKLFFNFKWFNNLINFNCGLPLICLLFVALIRIN